MEMKVSGADGELGTKPGPSLTCSIAWRFE